MTQSRFGMRGSYFSSLSLPYLFIASVLRMRIFALGGERGVGLCHAAVAALPAT